MGIPGARELEQDLIDLLTRKGRYKKVELAYRAKVWNTWRRRKGKTTKYHQLEGIAIKDIDFPKKLIFTGFDFTLCVFYKCTFSSTTFNNCKMGAFSRTVFNKCTFTNCSFQNLENVKMEECTLEENSFKGQIHHTDFSKNEFGATRFEECDLRYVSFEKIKAPYEDRRISLKIAFSDTILCEVNFTKANLKHCTFVRTKVEEPRKMPFVTPEGVTFLGANLYSATFSDSAFPNTDFSKTSCLFAGFNNTLLRGAIFIESNLGSVSFKDSDLTQANFFKAKIGSANFKEANLKGAIIDKSQLKDAVGLEEAKNLDKIETIQGDLEVSDQAEEGRLTVSKPGALSVAEDQEVAEEKKSWLPKWLRRRK